jgi:precorrin-6B methylase 1
LVTDEILSLIPPHVRLHNVGKRCGPKMISQEEIQEKIVRAARSGQTVVRLKGGDPLVFGRAQEEIGALREHGIPFEIVPGVTAACAAAAVAQISLTDRKTASKVVFISNHQCAGKSARQWEKTFEDSTLVFYMPGGNLESLQKELLDRADEAIIAEREFLIDAESRIFEPDNVVALGFGKVAGGEDLHAHDFQFRSRRGAFVAWAFVAGNGGGKDFALLKERSDEAVADAVVLDTFSDREDIRIRGFEEIVHDDAAFDGEPGLASEFNIRANAGGNNNKIGWEFGAVFEPNTLGA